MKRQVIIIDRENNRAEIKQIEQCQVVCQFIYLGTLITNRGGCKGEIKICEMAKRSIKYLQKTWVNCGVTLNTKKQILKN